ncbi:MAG: 50S ribosomal protein L10 [bacterium]|nr:50S ribosomal protein L10 [bacterium]
MENEEKKKSASRIKKEEEVASLVEKMNQAQALLLTDFRGLSVAGATELKGKLKADKAEMLVAKNTLLSIAAKKAGYEVPAQDLTGPTAAIFAYEDQVSPIKALATFIKGTEIPKIKIGFLNKEAYSKEKIMELAKLPSKEVLLGQVVGGISSPLYGVVRVLNANLRNLVYTLDQIGKSKGSTNA